MPVFVKEHLKIWIWDTATLQLSVEGLAKPIGFKKNTWINKWKYSCLIRKHECPLLIREK